MPLPRPLLATSMKALTRSVLFSLGVDHALIDFLACAAVGTAAVLFAILFVALRIPRRQAPAGSIPSSHPRIRE